MKNARNNENNMANDSRIVRLETIIENINNTLNRFDKRFDEIDRRFEIMDNKIDRGFESLNNRIWYLFFWMIGGFIGVLGLLAHSLHWF